jgi:hypothetical protein
MQVDVNISDPEQAATVIVGNSSSTRTTTGMKYHSSKAIEEQPTLASGSGYLVAGGMFGEQGC